MMLGARVYETDTASGRKIMVLAFQLNPNEKYVNYYLGKYYLNLNQTDTAAKYLQQELKGSSYYDTHFLLSRVYFLKQDIANSLTHMEQYLELDPGNPQANNNYILMLSENNQLEKAKQYIDKKQAEGMQLPSALVNSVNQRLLMQPSK
jgi:Tfp pilus assembly protein PilF